MRLPHRIHRTINSLRFKFVPTDEIITRIKIGDSEGAKHALIEILRERLAHQDGSLHGVDWSLLEVSNIMLASSKMPSAQFHGAKLAGAYFGYCELRGANFERSDLREANLRDADLAVANFAGANLSGANFARANLQGCSFQAADLSDANLWGADLRGANFADAKLANCCLTAALVNELTGLPDSVDIEKTGAEFSRY